MSRRSVTTILYLTFLAALASAQTATPAEETTFLVELKADLAQKNYAAFSALICHDGTLDPTLRAMVEKSMHDSFDLASSHKAPEITFIPVPTTQLTSFNFQGKAYEINLKPVELLQVKFTDVAPTNGLQSVQFPLGLKDGNLLIATTKEKGS